MQKAAPMPARASCQQNTVKTELIATSQQRSTKTTIWENNKNIVKHNVNAGDYRPANTIQETKRNKNIAKYISNEWFTTKSQLSQEMLTIQKPYK